MMKTFAFIASTIILLGCESQNKEWNAKQHTYCQSVTTIQAGISSKYSKKMETLNKVAMSSKKGLEQRDPLPSNQFVSDLANACKNSEEARKELSETIERFALQRKKLLVLKPKDEKRSAFNTLVSETPLPEFKEKIPNECIKIVRHHPRINLRNIDQISEIAEATLTKTTTFLKSADGLEKSLKDQKEACDVFKR